MLYISRIYGGVGRYGSKPEYGVVDSDDGVETVVSFDDLRRICVDTGLQVLGVHKYLRHVGAGTCVEKGNMIVSIGSIVPYQPPETMTIHQNKLLAMYGIRLSTYKDLITCIETTRKDADSVIAFRLRLSQFGSRCADHILGYQTINSVMYELTLVLDDNCPFTDTTFFEAPVKLEESGGGIKFDVCECTDSDKIFKLYLKAAKTLKSVHKPLEDIRLSIIDMPFRYNQFISLLSNKDVMRAFGV